MKENRFSFNIENRTLDELDMNGPKYIHNAHQFMIGEKKLYPAE